MSNVLVFAAIGTIAYIGYKYLTRQSTGGLAFRQEPIRVRSVYLERGSDGVFRPTNRPAKDRI